MKGKIKTVQPQLGSDFEQRSFTTDNGTFWCFVVEMEDGTRGEVSGKTKGTYRFSDGDEVEYTYTPSTNEKYLGKLKLNKPEGFSGGGKTGGWSPEKEASVMIQGLLKSVIESGAPKDQWPILLGDALKLHDQFIVSRTAKP